MVMMSMCFAGTIGVFAGYEPETGAVLSEEGVVPEEAVTGAEPANAEMEVTGETGFAMEAANADLIPLPQNGTINPANINTEAESYYIISNFSGNHSFYINMPAAGTLILKEYSEGGKSLAPTVSPTSLERTYSGTADDGTIIRAYAVPEAQTVTVSNYIYSGDQVLVLADYAPNAVNTIAAPVGKFSKEYYHGGTGNTSTVTKFKVKVNSPGYLALDVADNTDYGYTVQIKTSGFKDYEYVSSSNIRRFIGVKKGTYTFTVKSYAPVYTIKARLYKMSQSKYGTSKKKAVAIKAKKAAKGLIITNAKKAHWYKFKNTSLHKVYVTIKSKNNGGGGYGGYRVTLYDKRGSMGSFSISDDTSSQTISLYTIGKNDKLVKGTYWIKVESYNGGNGYFTVKWK